MRGSPAQVAEQPPDRKNLPQLDHLFLPCHRVPAYPDPAHSLMVTRTDYGPVSHEWTANDDDAGHHHGLIDFNGLPCYLALYWQSRAKGRTVHVGTYKLNLRALVKAGFAQEKAGRKVRLRFVRDADGTVAIRPNESSAGLPVGVALFEDTGS